MTTPGVATGAPVVGFDDAGKQFGQTWAVRNLNLGIPAGTILGLIGPSGSGKTTTVRLATGAYQPTEGAVSLFGSPPHQLRGSDRMTIGYLPQEPVLSEDLSLWENLNFLASLNGVRLRRRKRLHGLLDLVELDGDRRKLVRESSGGMKRRLALAATLAHDAPILVLDEPTAGIDPILRRRFWDHFRALRDDGHTLIVATQYVGEAADCDHVVLLAQGTMVAADAPEELRRRAYGGDVIHIESDQVVGEALLAQVLGIDGVKEARAVRQRQMRLVVDNGGAVMPKALAVLEQSGHRVVDSEEVVGDYDDVFVNLVDRFAQRADGEHPAHDNTDKNRPGRRP